MDRSEDLKQVRDLHLVRDERDREVEAAAGLRAGNAVVLVSQLLSAVCLLQVDQTAQQRRFAAAGGA